MRVKYPNHIKEKAIQLRREGKTTREISAMMGVGMTTLKEGFKTMQLNRLYKGEWHTEKGQETIVEEYPACGSPKAIMDKYGISKTTLYHWRRKFTVVARSHSGMLFCLL